MAFDEDSLISFNLDSEEIICESCQACIACSCPEGQRYTDVLTVLTGQQSVLCISVQGCDLCLSGDSQCSSFHKRCEKNENGDFCQTSASCGEGFGFSDADKCGACIPLSECLGCPDHSVGTCNCEKCSGSLNDVFGIRAESECSVGPGTECSIKYGHCQGKDFRMKPFLLNGSTDNASRKSI